MHHIAADGASDVEGMAYAFTCGSGISQEGRVSNLLTDGTPLDVIYQGHFLSLLYCQSYGKWISDRRRGTIQDIH